MVPVSRRLTRRLGYACSRSGAEATAAVIAGAVPGRSGRRSRDNTRYGSSAVPATNSLRRSRSANNPLGYHRKIRRGVVEQGALRLLARFRNVQSTNSRISEGRLS